MNLSRTHGIIITATLEEVNSDQHFEDLIGDLLDSLNLRHEECEEGDHNELVLYNNKLACNNDCDYTESFKLMIISE